MRSWSSHSLLGETASEIAMAEMAPSSWLLGRGLDVTEAGREPGVLARSKDSRPEIAWPVLPSACRVTLGGLHCLHLNGYSHRVGIIGYLLELSRVSVAICKVLYTCFK